MKNRCASTLSFFAGVILLGLGSQPASAQMPDLAFINGNHPIVDAHNCYPYENRWSDRVDRALKTGFPVGIEQDLAWYQDPVSGKGRVVVSHTPKTTGAEPDERQYFFEHVRPMIEKELAHGDASKWPLIVLHFDFKDNQPALLHAVWDLLGEYESWIVTAPKTADPHQLAAFSKKPILVMTEDPDAQEEVFFNRLPVGSHLRLFGSGHTVMPKTQNREEQIHLAATLAPSQLLPQKATNYRRWWNNSWYEVEEGGQPKAGAWTEAEMTRLQSLVDYAHGMGYWIRFYTLDGFTPDVGEKNGWLAGYNFGSLAAAQQRWHAAVTAGVDLIASDQYEDLAPVVKSAKKP